MNALMIALCKRHHRLTIVQMKHLTIVEPCLKSRISSYEKRPSECCVIFHGWGGGIRTPECQDQNLVPYRLATPQCAVAIVPYLPFEWHEDTAQWVWAVRVLQARVEKGTIYEMLTNFSCFVPMLLPHLIVSSMVRPRSVLPSGLLADMRPSLGSASMLSTSW